ncbi:MAG: S1C family serine protease [Spirochaetales bacterium]
MSSKKNIILIITGILIVTIATFLFVNVVINPSPTTIFYNNSSSIVELKCVTESEGESFGTAEIIKDDGTLVTNAHVVTFTELNVVTEFDSYFIRFSNEEEYREVSLIKYDTEKDIAVLKIDDISLLNIKPIKIGTSNNLKFGERVYAIGNGSNYGLAITEGIISMPIVNIEYSEVVREVIQCDLTITAGNSGGALLNNRGELIGITTFRTRDNSGNTIYGIAYSIPIDDVIEYVNS